MGRRALACLAVLAVGGCGGGAAKPTPPHHGAAAHASGPRLTPAIARTLTANFRKQVKDTGAPGATAAIVFPDGRVWTSAVGLAVLHPARRMTTRTSFSLDDVTKLATATLALKLAEEGRLSLDDRISRWYPAWGGDPAATVRELLGHTSGAQDPNPRYILLHPRRAMTSQQYADAAPKPGPRTTEAQYSNSGFVIAGQILARAGGAPVNTLMRREIFDHPGGARLALQPADHAHLPLAHDYWYPHGLSDPVDATGSGPYLPFRAFDGSFGAAAALAGDDKSLARWAHVLLGGHVLAPASLRQMTRFHPIEYAEGYGLGLIKSSQDGHEMWGHVGDGVGSHTELWHLPRDDLTIATSWNDDPTDSDTPILRTLLRGALGTA